MIKIAHIIWALPVGGAETMLVDIVNEQSKTREVHLIIINNIIDNELLENISERVKLHFLNRPAGSKNPVYIIQFNWVILNINPEIIHCHNDDLCKILFTKKLTRSKTYLTVHNTKTSSKNIASYDGLFSISDTVKKNILSKKNIRVKTIFNGIKIDSIQTKQNYSFKKFKIIQIGRLITQIKGQHILLKALSILVNNYSIKNIQVDFWGEGESEDELLELARELNIENFCKFKGYQTRSTIYANLQNYDLLVQPSLYEGFGLTVAEGMAAKIPVLVSSVEGPMEIIDQGRYGYFFDSEDPSSCAEIILKIIQEYGNDNFHKKIEQGHLFVSNNFTIRQTAENYLNHY